MFSFMQIPSLVIWYRLSLMLIFATSMIDLQSQDIKTNRFIIKLKEGAEIQSFSLNKLVQENYKVTSIRCLNKPHLAINTPPHSTTFSNNLHAIKFSESVSPQETIMAFMSTGLVEYAEPDYQGIAAATAAEAIPPNDTYLNRQWYINNDGTFPRGAVKAGADLQLLDAWDIETGDSTIIIASIDSGVKTTHPELKRRIWKNANEINGNDTDDDHNGFIDDVHGWNFITNSNLITDDNRHGTHVAGVMAATANNSTGYSGIDWHCKIMVCKVLSGDLTGYYSDFIEAIHYAVDNGANIINMSLGGDAYSKAFEEAVLYAESHGVLIVASMQNDNTDKPYYPAAFDPVIAVGATDPNDTRSLNFINAKGGSSYGQHIDVVAPGNYIYGLNNINNDNYSSLFGGTSLATPMVSGVLSLLMANQPTLTTVEVRERLFTTCDDQVGDIVEDIAGWDPYYGFGRVNAYRILTNSINAETSTAKVYPNPTNGPLHIRYSLDGPSDAQVKILTTQGVIVYDKLLPLSRIFNVDLQLQHLAEGVYIMILSTRFGQIQSKFIRTDIKTN